jgi:hypothetical protein
MVCRLQDDGSCPNGHTIWGASNAARWSTRRRYVSTAASSLDRPRCATRSPRNSSIGAPGARRATRPSVRWMAAAHPLPSGMAKSRHQSQLEVDGVQIALTAKVGAGVVARNSLPLAQFRVSSCLRSGQGSPFSSPGTPHRSAHLRPASGRVSQSARACSQSQPSIARRRGWCAARRSPTEGCAPSGTSSPSPRRSGGFPSRYTDDVAEMPPRQEGGTGGPINYSDGG